MVKQTANWSIHKFGRRDHGLVLFPEEICPMTAGKRPHGKGGGHRRSGEYFKNKYGNGRAYEQGQPWTESEDNTLRELIQKGTDIREIAFFLKRSLGAVRARSKKLGLPRPR